MAEAAELSGAGGISVMGNRDEQLVVVTGSGKVYHASAEHEAQSGSEPGGLVLPSLNPSGIFPTEYKILVMPDDVPDVTSGGILVPVWARDQRQAACVTGTIVAMADEAYSFVEDPSSVRVPRIGERVAFTKYAGMAVRGKDKKVYKLMNDKDVAAILEFAFDVKDFQF